MDVLIAHSYGDIRDILKGWVNALLRLALRCVSLKPLRSWHFPGPRAQVDVGLLIRTTSARQEALQDSRCDELILFGSMGGLITAASALIYRKDLRCIVLEPAFHSPNFYAGSWRPR